jgi:hypothetical protein
MTPGDFRRVALSLDGVEQGSHMGAVDFRVGGRIFATLAHQSMGYGNLMLSPEQQAAFVEELPDVFVPVAGGWGRMGATHLVLAKAAEDVMHGALRTAWRLRVDMNARTRKAPSRAARPPRRTAVESRASRSTTRRAPRKKG